MGLAAYLQVHGYLLVCSSDRPKRSSETMDGGSTTEGVVGMIPDPTGAQYHWLGWRPAGVGGRCGALQTITWASRWNSTILVCQIYLLIVQYLARSVILFCSWCSQSPVAVVGSGSVHAGSSPDF